MHCNIALFLSYYYFFIYPFRSVFGLLPVHHCVSSHKHKHRNKNKSSTKHETMWFCPLYDAIVKLISLCFIDPPFISKARSTSTPVGQKAILQCEASAVPRAEFEWYKDDRRQVSPLSFMISSD